MSVTLILVKVTITIALALGLSRALTRSRAAVRHLVLMAAFGVLLILPVAARITPAIEVAVPLATSQFADQGPFVFPGEAPVPTSTTARTSTSTSTGHSAPIRRAPLSLASVLVGVWLAGAVLFAVPMILGLRQMRTLRRTAGSWPEGQALAHRIASVAGLTRTVDVRLHDSVSGPMTCGVVRPSILLPTDARLWPEADLHAAVVHELAHVARFDWLHQCFARAIAALYWFHPLVWIARRRLVLEAERACDDAVLRSAEATAYADQLVLLAARLSTVKQPALAMANRADLAARIRSVLDGTQARGQAGRWAVTATSLAALAAILVISPLTIVASSRQPSPQGTPRFDAVSIKPCPDDTPPPSAGAGARSGQGGFPNVSPGRFFIECGTIERMISNAYVLNGERLENNQARIGDVSWWKGGPGWLRTDKYTIEAIAPGTTDRKVILGPMLRALLEDRFKLRLHRETAEVPLYALTVAKGGLKIKPIGPDGCETFDPDAPLDRAAALDRAAGLIAGTIKPTCGSMHMTGAVGFTRWIIGGTTLGNFAGTLSAHLDRFTLDRTGITDRFNIKLEFQRDEHVPGADKRFGVRTEFPEGDGPNIFAALEQQLGLKLESIRGPQGYLVIDHVERPVPNGPEDIPARAKGAGR